MSFKSDATYYFHITKFPPGGMAARGLANDLPDSNKIVTIRNQPSCSNSSRFRTLQAKKPCLILLLSAKSQKCTIYHPGVLRNRTSGLSFPKVSPPNQTGSVLEEFPLRFEPSLPNPFRGLQEKYSSLHNT